MKIKQQTRKLNALVEKSKLKLQILVFHFRTFLNQEQTI